MDKQVKARPITVYREMTEAGSFKTVGAEVFHTDGTKVTCEDQYSPQKFEVGKYVCKKD